ncbi:MAG: cell division protein FtsX [Roseomonas sp.]|nr:cell division protein FtsX [Roseomonas sp.]MCA3328160.1 cell division protein FtsX [Roseomonas sp.]MCA3330484.1 cell division protein FtsX [Roseomonas sp.]MCA3336665.1 cell division protein FtsX [Roseomonas sp.]MCA3348734.1 cell division protein FtsX [Roseomonas sp.]
MRRDAGGRGDPIGLRGALADRLLVALISAVALFATCALAGHEAVSQLTKRWQQGANAAVTVQIPDPTPLRMESALEALRILPAVREARAVDPARMAELLRPWLGDVAGLPLPGVIELRLADLAADPVLIGDRVSEAVPGAVTEAHGVFVARLGAVARALSTAALAAVLLVSAVGASVVVLAVRAGIAARRQSVMVLHMLGATDRDIAGRFARRTAWLAFLGASLGVALAVVLLGVFLQLAMPILPEIGMQDLPLIGVAAIPMSAALIAWSATTASILFWLRRLP